MVLGFFPAPQILNPKTLSLLPEAGKRIACPKLGFHEVGDLSTMASRGFRFDLARVWGGFPGPVSNGLPNPKSLQQTAKAQPRRFASSTVLCSMPSMPV